ncbi:hypothetical protein [Streptomyces sp. WAC01526]|nr:hypothetical protein [Streptomyces sp. WAC01526]
MCPAPRAGHRVPAPHELPEDLAERINAREEHNEELNDEEAEADEQGTN